MDTRQGSITNQQVERFSDVEWREFGRHFSDLVNEDTKFTTEILQHGLLLSFASGNGQFQILIRKNGTWRAGTSRRPIGLKPRADSPILAPELGREMREER